MKCRGSNSNAEAINAVLVRLSSSKATVPNSPDVPTTGFTKISTIPLSTLSSSISYIDFSNHKNYLSPYASVGDRYVEESEATKTERREATTEQKNQDLAAATKNSTLNTPSRMLDLKTTYKATKDRNNKESNKDPTTDNDITTLGTECVTHTQTSKLNVRTERANT